MVHLQAPNYSVPWADEEFLTKFGSIEGRKCHQIMHGRDSPCEKCPTFKAFHTKAFHTKEPVISEQHYVDGRHYITVVEALPYDLPLLVNFAVEQELPVLNNNHSQSQPISLQKYRDIMD